MNVPVTIPSKPSEIDIHESKSWDRAREFIQVSSKFEQCKLYAQAMCGIELRALQKREGLTHGGSRKVAEETKLAFSDVVKLELGISYGHARRLMEMGDALRKRFKKLPGLKDFEVRTLSIGDLDTDAAKTLDNAVRKITDGRTQFDLLKELGVYKAAKSLGGGARDGSSKSASGPEAALALQRQLADADWAHIEQLLRAYASKFLVLDDPACQAQVSVLESHLGFRKRWLAKPRAERNPEEIEAIVAKSNSVAPESTAK